MTDLEQEITKILNEHTFVDGAPFSTPLIDDLVQALTALCRRIEGEARIDELEAFNPLQTDHSNCPMPMTCIGYENAVSDFDNEKEIRLAELREVL